jgi:hypothetical protein
MSPYALAQVMSAWKAVLNTTPGWKVHLFQNNIVPTQADTLATYTEATFDGYAALIFTSLAGPSRDTDGSFRIYNDAGWSQTGSTTPNTIYGFYVTDHTGALIGAYRFATPVQMVDAFSSLDITAEFSLLALGIVGNSEPH